jgi:hypothetical protein
MRVVCSQVTLMRGSPSQTVPIHHCMRAPRRHVGTNRMMRPLDAPAAGISDGSKRRRDKDGSSGSDCDSELMSCATARFDLQRQTRAQTLLNPTPLQLATPIHVTQHSQQPPPTRSSSQLSQTPPRDDVGQRQGQWQRYQAWRGGQARRKGRGDDQPQGSRSGVWPRTQALSRVFGVWRPRPPAREPHTPRG